MQRLQPAFPVISTIYAHLNPADTLSLALTSTFFYKEGINFISWKKKLHQAGCPKEILAAANKTFAIKNYATLYKAFVKYFDPESTKNIQLWEILILSGERAAIEYAICQFNISKYTRSARGFSALKLAALSGKKGLKFTIERLNITPANKLILIVAYRDSHVAMDYCLNNLKLNLHTDDKRNVNALGYAALGNSVKMMKYLLNKQLKMSSNIVGNNCLHLAAYRGNIDVANFAIHVMGINPFSTNELKENALLIAGKYGNFEFVIYLLARENYLCDAQSKDVGQRTFLHLVCRQKNIDLINLALNTLKIPFDSQDVHGAQAFHHAAAAGNTDALNYFHKNTRTDFFATTKDGCNALHHAALSDNIDTIEFLFNEVGLPLNSKDVKGLRPIHYAAVYGNINVIRKLLELGAKPTDMDFRGHDVTFFANQSKTHKDELLKILSEYKPEQNILINNSFDLK